MSLRDELKSMLVSDPLAPENQSEEACARRLLVTFELAEAGVHMMRENLRRQHPDASEQSIQELLADWLQTRPGATWGDAEGTPRTIPTCPGCGKVSYVFQMASNPDQYTVVCAGTNHLDAGLKAPNFPQYTALEGLRDKP